MSYLLKLADAREAEVATEFASDGSRFAAGEVIWHDTVRGTFKRPTPDELLVG